MDNELDRLRNTEAIVPQRILVLSADMGEGHNAAAAALTEVIEELWPGCRVDRLDTFRVAGNRLAQAARWSYGFQLTWLPWSYQVFYDALSRYDVLTRGLKGSLGRFFGPRLADVVAGADADLIISTYPFGSAALEWLVNHRGLRTPTATYIPAFHVHPLWAYEDIDLHFVMYDTAPADARTRNFQRSMRIGAPPVRRGFGGVERSEARAMLGLDPSAFVVLVTGGAWGLGDLRGGVEGLVALDPPVHVLAVAGKNARLAAQLRGLGSDRLTVFDYVDNMPELMAAANVVVTNGAGVTVLEALQTPRPVVCFSPLVGHGRAATAEMLRRDLAVQADDVAELAEAVRSLASDQTLLHRMERAVEAWRGTRQLRRSVEELLTIMNGPEEEASPTATA
jgi:diacylglycerol O-acyltransferase